MHRLFVALRPPGPVRAQLLALMGGVPGARWQDEDQLHITLRFIGAVETRVAEDIALALSNVHAAPLTLALDGVGSFGARGRPNALWAGLRPHDAAAELHKKVDHALVRAGLEPERRAYLPHVTLARFSSGAAADVDPFLRMHAALASAPFTLDHLLLFESHLGRERARYSAVGRFALRG